MTREEAIQEMREKLPWLTEDTKRLVEALIPELAESEEERIRKEIIEFVDTTTLSSDERHHRWIAYLEKQKEQKPVKWEDYKDKVKIPYCSSEDEQKSAEWSEEELAKKHLDGYCMGREDTLREMKDFVESHFNTKKALEGEDLTDLYRKEYAQPLCLRNGGVCTNPMRDCINCIPTLERFNTTSGTSTLKAE